MFVLQTLASTLLPPSSLPSLASFVPSQIPMLPPPDVSVECSDGFQIAAHAVIISLNSPTLIPQVPPSDTPTSPGATGRPVVKVDLRPDVFCELLRVCYQGEESELPGDLVALADLMVAAQKHRMSRVCKIVKRCWDEHANAAPVQAYCVAKQRMSLDSSLARTAAKGTLKKPLVESYHSEMETTSAEVYHYLIEYHRTCARAVAVEINRTKSDWVSEMTPIAIGGDKYVAPKRYEEDEDE